MFTITSISTGITSLFFLGTGLTVLFSWSYRKLPTLKFFSVFLLAFGFQQLFFSLGTGPAALNPRLSNGLWALAHIFMFLAVSYFLRLPFRISFPSLEKTFFILALVYSFFGTVVLFLNIPKVEPFLLENGVYNWRVPPLVGAIIGIFTTICLLFSFAVFARGVFKIKEAPLKIRSLMLAVGVLVFLIGGPVHNFVTTPILNFLADASLIAGSLLMVLGVYLPKFWGVAPAIKEEEPHGI